MARRPSNYVSDEKIASTVRRVTQEVALPQGLTATALGLLSRAVASPRVDPTMFGCHHAYELPDADTVAGRDLIARGFVEVVDGRPLLTVAAVINARLWGTA